MYEQPSRINSSIWLDVSQRRAAREVKCKSALSNREDWILDYIRTNLVLLV